MDKIIEVLSDKANDEFDTEHQPGSNNFTLKREDER